MIDDGSEDDSHKKIQNLECDQFKLYRYEQNRGKGFAIRYGLNEILKLQTYDYIGFTDADFATPLAEIDKIYDKILNTICPEFVIGNRNTGKAVYENPFRSLMSKCFNYIAHLPLAMDYSDTQAGFKFYKKSFAKNIVKYSTVDHFAFDIEHIMIAELFGFKVEEYPIENWVHGEFSKVSPFKDSWKMFKDTLQLKLVSKYNIQKKIKMCSLNGN